MPRTGKTLFTVLMLITGYIITMWALAPQVEAAPMATSRSAPTQSITLTPVADAYVSFVNASDNFGTATSLYVSSTDSTIQRASLLRFDLGAIPQDAIIERATLVLHQRDSSLVDEWKLAIDRFTQGWDETTVTYRAVATDRKYGVDTSFTQ